MHQDYFAFGSAPSPGQSEAAWSGYTGARPAKITMALLALHLLTQLVLIAGRLAAPTLFYGPAANFATGLLLVGLLIATAVAFLTWFKRAYETVNRAVGTAQPPSQVAWMFFIPILNLFRPYQLITEIWRKTDDDAGASHHPLLIAWWGLWVVFGTGPFLASIMGLRGISGLGGLSLWSMLASVALAFCAIAVVRMLDTRIRDKVASPHKPATF